MQAGADTLRPGPLRRKKPKFTREQLEGLVARGLSQEEIATELGTYRTYVCRLLRRYGIPYVARPNAPNNPAKMYPTLYEKRVVGKKTVAEIASELGLSPSQVYYRLRRLHLTGPQVMGNDMHAVLVAVQDRLNQALERLDTDVNQEALRADLHFAAATISLIVQGGAEHVAPGASATN